MAEKKPKKSEIDRCERCGKMIIFTKYTLCHECRQDEKGEVERAMDFLKTHPGASLQVISESTGVEPSIVLRLIRGGRVEVSEEKKGQKRKK